MTCRDVAGFLGDYLDGQLPGDARARFEAHLAECPACVRYLRQYRDTIRLAREAHADVPAEPPADLLAAILAARAAAAAPAR